MPKILVADDNANIQKMVSLSFEDRGIQVVAVGNGEAAVRRIPDLNPDLVLADIFMPVRNGYEVCEFVKKDERFSHVPVILLVGAFDPLDEKEARRVGADGVLKKPFVPPDPLIAMVMSALEKNPKVAAELAKTREAKEAPPPPVESIPEPSTSARAELKPLPEFPEPSAEEAALIYGFGTGKRAIDDSPIDTSNEPKPPVVEAQEQEQEEEEFDSSSTRRDWRRNAMEIEIPAEAANQPAFDQFETAMFPSEREVPPKRVPVSEVPKETQLIAKDEESASLVEEVKQPAAEAPVEAQQSSAETDFFASSDASIETQPVVSTEQPPQPNYFLAESTAEPVIEAEPAREETRHPAPSHWMDGLAQTSSDHSPTDWMSALYEQTAGKESEPPAQTSSLEPQAVSTSPATFVMPVEPDVPAVDPDSLSEVQSHVDAAHSAHASTATHHASSGETFFADDAETAPSVMNDSWLSAHASEPQSAPLPLEESVETTAASAVPVAESSMEKALETEADSEPPFAFKDPELVEPPAVHVTPEPLLVEDDGAQGESQYGLAKEQEVQPLHSFFVPAIETSVSDAGTVAESSRAQTPSGLFGPEPEAIDGRVPTGPPPNREALAEIPFLTPPPDFHAPAHETAMASPETVDAVVRKVLEKLEPQLHDLLSQGVLKPLVENLLQGELAKKEK